MYNFVKTWFKPAPGPDIHVLSKMLEDKKAYLALEKERLPLYIERAEAEGDGILDLGTAKRGLWYF